jgi:endonuclease YncB( thermonuclease family)
VRYVKNGNGTDLGLWQIKMGVANARYDSRDGYAKHPHEAEYHRADAETVHMCEGVK